MLEQGNPKASNAFYISVSPSPLTPDVLRMVIDSDESPDAVIIGTYGSGTVPQSLLPVIEYSADRQIPIFGIRQTQDADLSRISEETGDETLPGIYEPEVEAIKKGLVPLQQTLGPNESNLATVIAGINEICDQHKNYEDRIAAAKERFSSPRFNEVLDRLIS